MADPTGVTVRTIKDVIPGFTLSEPSWLDNFDIEEELNRRYMARSIDVAVRSQQMTYDEAEGRAVVKVSSRPFPVLEKAFMTAVLTDRTLTPHLLVACLMRNHPGVSLEQAKALLRDDARFWEIRTAILSLFGFTPKKADAGETPDPAAGLTGGSSSLPSDGAGSAGPKSER